ncbi:MAG TPA: trypsin-like peptidase domain-containing protein [Candidatus Eisenbacteria bacterium]|nr:trypsin-like peptidase domain-containing protein [Candidatus Eisenbacteria bacterium]
MSAAGRIALLFLLALAPVSAQAAGAKSSASIDDSRRSAIVTAAERASPAVVSVSVVQTRVVRENPFYNFFPDEFFDRFYPQMEYRERLPALGSGFIVDPSGVVVTNNHVTEGADEIKVTLPDGRQLPAKLMAASPVYDLAFVKVEGHDLPTIALGNSDDLIVGEWAIAIGNPFGFLLDDPHPSVTAGVVSATHRDIKSEASEGGTYKDMIQTDAAINPGNSGGPLVNALGQVIGVNTFIFTRSGGSVGIGFAVPINTVKRLLDEVHKYGRIRAVWAGFQVQPLTAYLANRLGLDKPGGLVVTRVEPNSPATAADLRVGDVLRSVNGKQVNTAEEAQRVLFGSGVGDHVTLQVERNGKRRSVQLTFGEMPQQSAP